MKREIIAQGKRNKIIAIFFIILLVLIMFFATIFVVEEIDHDCDGENCPICYQISVCENIIKVLGNGLIVAITAIYLLTNHKLYFCFKNVFVKKLTLVILKVKLSI